MSASDNGLGSASDVTPSFFDFRKYPEISLPEILEKTKNLVAGFCQKNRKKHRQQFNLFVVFPTANAGKIYFV